MKLLVCGSRTITDQKYIFQCLDEIIKDFPEIIELVEGNAPGVDRIAGIYAKQHNIKLTKMPANWMMYGKQAGFIRNVQMVDLCDVGCAIWDGKSRGTAHTISLLEKQNKLIKVFQ